MRAIVLGAEPMTQPVLSRLSATLKRYFSVKGEQPCAEQVEAKQSAQRAVAAAAVNVAASVRLSEELSKLDGIMRHGSQ